MVLPGPWAFLLSSFYIGFLWQAFHNGSISRPCGELEVVSLTRAHHRGNHKQRNGDMELPRWGVDDVAPWDGFGFHGFFFLQ